MSLILDAKSQNDIWKHMCKESIIRLGNNEEFKSRKEILDNINNEVTRGIYTPKPIHGFLSVPKGKHVARFIPVFSYQDVAVYFGCVKAFDEILANCAVENTFGGWSLGGKRRRSEEEHAKLAYGSMLTADYLDDYEPYIYAPISCFNRSAWFENWQAYWQILADQFEQADDDAYFAIFDIANFYDNIDLYRLERQIRNHCGNYPLAIEVLFYLLSVWNKKNNHYARNTKGLPQDIIGDCSRILANFYLVPFDNTMKNKSLDLNCQFIRYSDDMVFVCQNLNICKNLIFHASTELHKIGLNINTNKVKFLKNMNLVYIGDSTF